MHSIFNNLQKHFISQVVLYHATYSRVPENLKKGLHNVAPDEFRKQLKWLKNNFKIVTVDELFQNPGPGQAAITFDEAYKSVFDEALPIIKDLKVPVTVFVNGHFLTGGIFWRDKIRFLINNNLVSKFIDYYKKISKNAGRLDKDNFYWNSKSLEINSREIDRGIDGFFKKNNINMDDLKYCLSQKSDLVNDELITYGNHGFSHYNLPSLTRQEQAHEIIENHKLLKSCQVKMSRIFSVPWGNKEHFNETTIEILKNLGYKGFLLTRNKFNVRFYPEKYGLPFAERYLAPPTYKLFQKQIFRRSVKEILSIVNIIK